MSISFVNGASSVTVENPQLGYSSDIRLPFHYTPVGDARFTIWDDGPTYDRRYTNAAELMVNATDMGNLNDFFSDPTKGRGEDVNLVLGGTPSGFFPFGPDKGDVGTFSVRMKNYGQSPQLWNPFRWWNAACTLVMRSAPAYSILSGAAEGSLQIGSVTGLQYPQGGYDSGTQYSVNNVVTMSGAVYEIDNSPNSDTYRSTFSLYGNTAKTGALIDYLVTTARATNFTIIAPSGHYPFGYDKGGNGTYTVQLIEPTIKVTHLNYNNFRTDLKLNFISVA